MFICLKVYDSNTMTFHPQNKLVQIKNIKNTGKAKFSASGPTLY